MPARAKLPPGEGKRVPLNMRTTRELRERLEREAADSGRSLAQEVEARLERSFTSEEGRYLEFGDADTFEFCRLLVQIADMMTLAQGKRWKDDSSQFLYVTGAWEKMVEMRSLLRKDFPSSNGGLSHTSCMSTRALQLLKRWGRR